MIFNHFISFCVTALFSLFITGCSNNPNRNTVVLRELEKSISTSNKHLDLKTEFAYSYILDAVSNPSTKAKAEIWLPKAKLAKVHTLAIMRYIDSVKETFKRTYSSNNPYSTSGVRKFFIKESEGKVLYQRLLRYKHNMLKIDPLVMRDIGYLEVFNESIDSSNNKGETFSETYFASTTQIEASAILTNFQFKAKSIENRVIQLFSEQWTKHFVEDYVVYSAIVAQSSKYVRAGDELEIIAGLGSFNVGTLPTIKINGSKVALAEEGAAHYKFKAANKSGKHVIPTLIEFVDREGKKVQITKEVEYFVNKK